MYKYVFALERYVRIILSYFGIRIRLQYATDYIFAQRKIPLYIGEHIQCKALDFAPFAPFGLELVTQPKHFGETLIARFLILVSNIKFYPG